MKSDYQIRIYDQQNSMYVTEREHVLIFVHNFSNGSILLSIPLTYGLLLYTSINVRNLKLYFILNYVCVFGQCVSCARFNCFS